MSRRPKRTISPHPLADLLGLASERLPELLQFLSDPESRTRPGEFAKRFPELEAANRRLRRDTLRSPYHYKELFEAFYGSSLAQAEEGLLSQEQSKVFRLVARAAFHAGLKAGLHISEKEGRHDGMEGQRKRMQSLSDKQGNIRGKVKDLCRSMRCRSRAQLLDAKAVFDVQGLSVTLDDEEKSFRIGDRKGCSWCGKQSSLWADLRRWSRDG